MYCSTPTCTAVLLGKYWGLGSLANLHRAGRSHAGDARIHKAKAHLMPTKQLWRSEGYTLHRVWVLNESARTSAWIRAVGSTSVPETAPTERQLSYVFGGRNNLPNTKAHEQLSPRIVPQPVAESLSCECISKLPLVGAVNLHQVQAPKSSLV